MAETKEKTKDKANKKPGRVTVVLRNLKAEFKKIIWPDRKTVGRETAAVISFSVFLGIVIGLLDMVIKSVVGFVV